MRLEDISPDDLIDPDWLDSYEKEISALWWELVELNSNLFILEKISTFPFDLFQPIGTPFWRLVYASLFETSVMIIWRVALDPHRDALTLRRLKNSIVQNLRDEDHRSQLRDLLRSVAFEDTLSDIGRRVHELRRKRLAHLDRDWAVGLTAQQIKERSIRLSELTVLRDKVNSLFDLLCFGHRKSVHLIHYHPEVQHPPDVDARPDIERLLDCVVKESALLNMPEQQREVWPLWRKNLSPKELEALNKYRVKFGLPEA